MGRRGRNYSVDDLDAVRDKTIIERNWEAMRRWMEFIASRNPDFLRKSGVVPNFADWLAPDENTNKDLLATAYWALIAKMMAQMAHATGKDAVLLETGESFNALAQRCLAAPSEATHGE